MKQIVERLLASDELSVRFKILTGVLGKEIQSPEITALCKEIRTSPRVIALLSERTANGTIPGHVYQKWTGAHWVLSVLADIGYQSGDESLSPLIDQVCACWLSDKHVKGVPVIKGRPRRCASQESNALYSMLKLGFLDERADRLAENLMRWQWPDGGWNCDKVPGAATSSFHESWIPVRALALYAKMRNSTAAKEAVARAAELFLSRRLFRRLRDGSIIKSSFCLLCYPPYWHYSILNGLKVISEAGFIHDERCGEALDLLESKRLEDGGFPAEISYSKTAKSTVSGRSLVKWGTKKIFKMNEWVTAEALTILKAAGRIQVDY